MLELQSRGIRGGIDPQGTECQEPFLTFPFPARGARYSSLCWATDSANRNSSETPWHASGKPGEFTQDSKAVGDHRVEPSADRETLRFFLGKYRGIVDV